MIMIFSLITFSRTSQSSLELVDLLEAFQTNGSVFRANSDLQEVGMKSQTPLKAQTLTEYPFIVVLDHVDDGRSAHVRSGRIEVVETDGLLGPDREDVRAGMDR